MREVMIQVFINSFLCMQFILKNKKIIALVLIVSQLIVNAGMQTFAVSFSKVMNNTLEGMEQPEDISTRYYEEFRYESTTYLLNDSDSYDEEKSEIENSDENKESYDERETFDETSGETKENVNANDKKDETTTNVDDTEEYDDSLDDIEGDYEDVPEELDDDGNVINPTTRPNRSGQDYEEEPEEDETEYIEEPEEDETEYDEEPEEDETTVEETTEEETTEKETTEEETTEEETTEKETTEEETTEKETTEEETTEEETTEEETTTVEDETQVVETTVASSSEAEEVIEEEIEVATVSELEDETANDEIKNEEIEGGVASISEVLPLKKLASLSTLKKFDSLLGATPVGGDGTHVHKICGVAEGAECLHTEYASHSEVGDYRLIGAGESEILAEIIDDLIGRVDSGQGTYEYIEEPEYLVLGRDIIFDKSIDGAPRDVNAAGDYYIIDLVRDLYLCLNGHSIKNIRWTSSTNKQLYITNCGNSAELTATNIPTNYCIFDLNTKLFGIDKNITVRSGRIASFDNQYKKQSTFYGVIFDGENSTTGVDYVIQYMADSSSDKMIFENCEISNYKNDSEITQADALIRMHSQATLVLKDVSIHDNDGIANHIIKTTNGNTIAKIVTKGRCEIYNNNMSTGTGNGNFLHLQRTNLTIYDDGLYIYNNSKTPGAQLIHLSNSAVVNIEENATLKIDNNKIAKAVTSNSSMIVYFGATINAKGNFYITNNKVINCGTITTGVALSGIWVVKNQYINIADGVIKIEGNASYADDGVTPASDETYKSHHMYQVYCESKDTTEIFKMISGYKFNPNNRIGNIGFPSGQVGNVMKFTTNEVEDPDIVGTVFTADTYYFKDYVVKVIDNYAKITHKESDHRHKECGASIDEECTHKEVSSHTKEIMYYELSGELPISERVELITGLSASDATEYFYLTDDIDNSAGSLIVIKLLRDVYICLNGYSIKGIRFESSAKTVRICNCQDTLSTIRTASSGLDAYMFDCNAYLYGNQNKNIKLNTYGVGRVNNNYGNSTIYIYGIDIDSANTTGYNNRSRAYVNKKGGKFILENVDLHNCNTTTERFMYVNDEYAGGNFIIRDVNSYDLSGLVYSMIHIKGKSGAEGTFTIKGDCSFHNIKISQNASRLVWAEGYSSMIVEEGATLTFSTNTMTSTADSLFTMSSANSKFKMKQNSSLIIDNNILTKTTSNQGFLLFTSGSHELLGDVIVTNNKIYGCNNKKSDYIGAILASNNATLTIGNGKIYVNGNKAYLDQGKTLVDDKKVPQHHMYGFISGKTSLALTQKSGTKFNPDTRIPDFAFMGYATGTIAKWTSNEYEDSYKDRFSEMIVADTKYTPDFKVIHQGNYLVIKAESSHYHKVCGIRATVSCTHSEISSHTTEYQYSAASVDSVAAFVQALTGTDGTSASSYYYLPDSIEASSITTITPKRDVYLCLNGYDLKGFKFAGSKSIYLTNCKVGDESVVENKTTNLTFVANTYLYGVNQNITFHATRLCDLGGSYAGNNYNSHFYSIILDGTGLSGGKYCSLYFGSGNNRNIVIQDVIIQNISNVLIGVRFLGSSGAKAIFKDSIIRNCSFGDAIMYSDGANNVYFKGNNKIYNNKVTNKNDTAGNCSLYLGSSGTYEITNGELSIYNNESTQDYRKSLVYVDLNFTVARGAKLKIYNNKIKDKLSDDFTSILYFQKTSNKINLLGDVEITDNKVINCGTNNQKFITAVYFEIDKIISLADGKMTIKNNKSYSDGGNTLADDSTYVAQHMFQFLSVTRDNNIFAMNSGYKINEESLIDGIAFYSASGTGKIMNWNSNVANNLNSYENIFKPDKFFNPILDRRVEDGVLLLDYSDESEELHKHKMCGIPTSQTCTHTETSSHTGGISYKPLGPNVLKDETIMTNLLTDASGKSTKPNYFYLTEDFVHEGTRISISWTKDTYLCLNGHKIKGIELKTTDTATINITNCQSVQSSVSLVSEENLVFAGNTRVYGIKNVTQGSETVSNIIFYTPRLLDENSNATNMEFYNFIVDGTGSGKTGRSTIYVSKASINLKFEEITIQNIQKITRVFTIAEGKGNVNVTFKNVTVKNNKGIYQAPFYFGNQTTNTLTFKGTVEMFGNEFLSPEANGNGVIDLQGVNFTLESNSTFKFYNNQVAKRAAIFSAVNNKVNLKSNSSFEIYENTVNKNVAPGVIYGNTELVYIAANSQITALGDIKVVDNKVVNCGSSAAGTFMAAFGVHGTGSNRIKWGSGKITINNNKSYKDANATTEAEESKYPNHHMFQLYSFNTDLIFDQQTNTKFNQNSRVTVTLAGISEGKVSRWTSVETDNINSYNDIFTADYFGDTDPMLVVYKKNYVVLVSSANYHLHKICGIASNSTCTHTLQSAIHENVEFTRLGSSINADQFVNTIKGVSGQETAYYYLISDITTTTEKEIALQRDVYICLNGHSVSGFRWTGNGKNIYICNCQDEKVSTIKNILSTNLLFSTNVQLYGSKENNLKVNSGRVIDVTSTIANKNVAFYNVNFDGTGAKAIIWTSGKTTTEASSFYIGAAYTTKFENCIIQNFGSNKKFLLEARVGATLSVKNLTIKNNSYVKWSIFKLGESSSSRGTLNVEGYFDIVNNTSKNSTNDYLVHTYGDINIKANSRMKIDGNTATVHQSLFRYNETSKLTVAETGYFGITNNIMYKNTNSYNTGFMRVESNSNDPQILGDFEITGNKVYSCGTSTTGSYLYGLVVSTNRFLNIGNGKITIKDNVAYSDAGKTLVDDSKYKNHHIYQIFSNYSSHKTNGLFKVVSGKKINTESRIEGISYDAYNYNGNLVKWSTDTVEVEDLDKYNVVFKADIFKDDELEVCYDVENDWAMIAFGEPKHKHKLCGVATNSNCVHTVATSHGMDEVGYRKLTKELDRSILTSSFAGGGAFVLLDDINPANLGDGGDKNIAVTVSNDLYICLNGHSLKGITFTGGASKTVYITNCSNEKSTFENTVNSDAAFTNISAEIYGINKNIDVLYDRLANMNGAASNNQKMRIYSALFEKGTGVKSSSPFVYITQSSNNFSAIEDCDFENLHNQSLFEFDGARVINIKNSTFKNIIFAKYFMSFDNGVNKVTFEGNNIIDNIKYADENPDHFINFGAYTGNEFTIEGNLSITNSESYCNSDHFLHIGAGAFCIKENSKLYIGHNRLYNSAIQSRAILYTGDTAEVSLMGSLEISENKFLGTRQSHSDIGFVYRNTFQPIAIGSISIIIKDNTTSNMKANVRGLYSYYSRGVFEQIEGTKFNIIESRIDRVAINSDDYTGEIYTSWNRQNISNFDDKNFDEVFVPDDYAGRKGLIVAKFGEKIILTFGDHFHKVCGTLATESCVHGGRDHGIGITADIMKTYIAIRWGDIDELIRTLQAGGNYFLIRNIKFDTPTVIDVRDADLLLCLKGFYMENVTFTSSTGKKIYISTCVEQIEEEKDEEEEIEYDDDGNPILSPTAGMRSKHNDRGEVAIVATGSGVGALFNTDAEIYSPYKILKIYANKLYESSDNSSQLVFSGVHFHNDPETATANNYIEATLEEELLIDNVDISTMSNIGYIVKADSSTLTLTGDTNIYENNIEGLFDARSIELQSGSVKLYNNIIRRVHGVQNLISISNESYLLGSLYAQDNKIINANGSNNQGIITIFNIASPGYVHLGNSTIYMDNNNVYSDGGYTLTDVDVYNSHYLYNIYSNNFTSMFRQLPGTSINTQSRVNVSFDSPAYQGTVVKSWNQGDIYSSIFKADHNIDANTGFNRIRMNVGLEDKDLIIDDKIRIYFRDGINEKLKKGQSPITIKHVVTWGEPYKLEKLFNWSSRREFYGYTDEKGVFYNTRWYPYGLIQDRGSITLTARWSFLKYSEKDYPVPEKENNVMVKRDAVIVGGNWIYDTINKKWMYYLNENLSANVIENLFPNGESGIITGMSKTDTRQYLADGIYQIYYKGKAYFFRFDENGHMVTGLSYANGSYYYFVESGILEGAMQLEPIVIGNEKIVFDVYGRIVKGINEITGDTNLIRTTYKEMVGMDNYYDPIPSLVGWR